MFRLQHVLASFLACASLVAAAAAAAASLEATTPTSSSIHSLLSRELSQRIAGHVTEHWKEKLQNGGNHAHEAQRHLQEDEFDEFRELFKKTTVLLPDFETSQTIIFADLIVKARNVKCFDIVLGNINVGYELVSNQLMNFKVDINDLDLRCSLDYEWLYSFFSGSGQANIELMDNNANTVLDFVSDDFDLYPPRNSSVASCNAEIQITNMEFTGTFTDAVLNAFEGLLRTFVEDAVSTAACTELGSLGTQLVQDMISRAAQFLLPYLEPLAPEQANATVAESMLVVPDNVKLMDFSSEGEDQAWFYGVLQQVDAALGVWLIDPNTPRSGGKDLGVNIFLRENVLNSNRALEMAVKDFPFEFDPVLFQGEDALSETIMTLETVRVFGLDTFSTFAPFIGEGKYTLQNNLAWDFLSFELDVVLDMKPSSLENNILEATTDANIHIQENVKMKLGVKDINATMSLMLAIDQDAFGKLKVGPLLHFDNVLPCFWSSIFKSEVTVLEARVGDIYEPALEGFISKGIDNIVTESVKAAFEMYESVVIRALPNIFQTTVKRLLNDVFFHTYDKECPGVIDTPGLIDFRDLLLFPEDAPALGGSGTSPYGSLAASMFKFLTTQIATLEEDGTLSANDMFIRAYTETQSGAEGELHLPGVLLSLSTSDIDWAGFDLLLQGFRLSLSNLRVQNLDTMVPPFKFLQPTGNPYALDNEIHFGPVSGRPLNASAMFSISFGGEGAPFRIKNDVHISMTSSAFQALATVIARVEAMKLLNFPIDDLLNYRCWLHTIATPTLNELGFRVDPQEDRGLSLTMFANKFEDLNVVGQCENCTTSGLNLLPSVLALLRETNVTAVLASRLKFIVLDIVLSSSMQTFLDRMVNSASQKCPHSPAYTDDPDAIGAGYADLPVPVLSEVSIDTVQFALATTLQVGFVVFTQLYSETAVEPQDPLVEQMAFTIPEGSDLLSFSDFESIKLPSFLDGALDKVLGLLNGTRIDPVSGERDMSVNVFVRDIFGQEGVFEWKMEGISFGPEDLAVEFHTLRIEGLDSFTRFDVGVPVAPQTILNNLEMNKLVVKLDFGIRSGESSQRLQVAFSFEELSASVPLFAAIDKTLLKALKVGSLLRLPNIVPCFFSAVYGFSLPHLVVNVGKIHMPTVEGLMPETDASMRSLVDTLFLRYNATMHESLPSVFDNVIRPVLNSFFAYFIAEKGSSCSNPLLDSLTSARRLIVAAGSPFMDFRDLFLPEAVSAAIGGHGDSRYGDLIRSVWDLIEKEFLTVSDSNESLLNTDIIAPLTEDGNLYFPGDLLNEAFDLALGPVPTGIAFRISDLRIENMDTFGNPFSLLDPVDDEPNLINNTATIGVGEPLRIGAKVFVDVSNDETKIRNDFDISVSMYSMTAILTALLQVSEYRFAAFPIGDIFNLDCWLATIPPPAMDAYGVRKVDVGPSAAMETFMLTMKQLDLNISCAECSSPGLEELAALWSTAEASKEITVGANDLLEYLGNVLGSTLIQNRIDRMLNDAAKRCPHSPEYREGFSKTTYQEFETTTPESDTSLAILVMVVGATFAAVLFVFVATIRFFVRRRHRRWLKTLSNSQLMILKQRQEKEEEKEAELNATTQSMFTSSDVPLFVRWIMPVVIIGNIGFFISGHLSLGAEVTIQVTVAGQMLTIDKFYQFSIAASTVEIWEAGGKELAILILIFSGIWPYTKQLITLVLWFLPPTWCSISLRGSILLWLDTLAKWSIIDIFTLIVSIAAFRVSVHSPRVDFLPDDLYSLDLLVVPMWGLYANLIAQLISQVSSHFIVHYHRNILHRATGSFKQNHHLVRASIANLALAEASDTSSNDSLPECPYGERKDLLHGHAYARPHRGESGKLITRSYVNTLVVFGAVVFSVLVVLGCVLPSAGLDFLGLLGVAVEAGQGWQQAVTKLSLFGLVELLMDQAAFVGGAKAYVGLGTLSSLLIISVLIVPLAQTAVLMYQWFVPMTGKKRRHMAIVVEILQAWQYMEVYVLSVIVATWQLGPISTFMINGYCGDLQETFDLLSYFGILQDEDAQCFRVDASIESGSYILVIAAIVLALLNTLVMNAVKQYFRDRDELISRSELKERALQMMEVAERPEEPTVSKDGKVEGDEAEREDATVDYWEGREEAEDYIKPVPVLFTDKFRYLLRRATPREELNGQCSLRLPTSPDVTTDKFAASEASTDDEVPTSHAYVHTVNEGTTQRIEPTTVTVLGSGSSRNRLPSYGSDFDQQSA